MIWTNFVKSLRPRQTTGNFMGEDYFGNRYFEIPVQENSAKRRPERWFVPPGHNDDKYFDSELTAEWESWLRHRRYKTLPIWFTGVFPRFFFHGNSISTYSAQPPTDAELKQNLAIMQMKKKNAAELDAKYADGKQPDPALAITTGLSDFPKYDEYETVVGKRPSEKEKKPHVLDRLK